MNCYFKTKKQTEEEEKQKKQKEEEEIKNKRERKKKEIQDELRDREIIGIIYLYINDFMAQDGKIEDCGRSLANPILRYNRFQDMKERGVLKLIYLTDDFLIEELYPTNVLKPVENSKIKTKKIKLLTIKAQKKTKRMKKLTQYFKAK